MSENKAKPTRPSRVVNQPATQGTIYGTGASVDVKLKIKPPGSNDIDALAKFAQLIMYGIATLAIWGGIFSIAFAENATNQNFLILGIGGILSAGMALTLVEMQRRKGGDGLHAVHDYLLGISFFFAAIGVLWGTRYLMGVLASQGFEWLLEPGIPYADTDWSPSANGIYVQSIACTALVKGGYLFWLGNNHIYSFSITCCWSRCLAFLVWGCCFLGVRYRNSWFWNIINVACIRI